MRFIYLKYGFRKCDERNFFFLARLFDALYSFYVEVSAVCIVQRIKVITRIFLISRMNLTIPVSDYNEFSSFTLIYARKIQGIMYDMVSYISIDRNITTIKSESVTIPEFRKK